MKFVFHVEKRHVADVGRSFGHNTRQKATTSQLRPAAWFTREGHHAVRRWDESKIRRAKGLARRKDAVVALSFVVQVGNQFDWREPGDEQLPEGRPRLQPPADIESVAKAVNAWAVQEFGCENLVAVDLHTDESSPHVHVVVTPIYQGKLDQKHWLGGSAKMQAIRRRAFKCVGEVADCEYTPCARGGEPHRPELRAGEEALQLTRPLLELHRMDAGAAEDLAELAQEQLDELRAQIFASRGQ